MKKITQILVLSLFLMGLTTEKPLANWAEFSPHGMKYNALNKLKQDQCLPHFSSSEFPVPESAKILITSWRKTEPRCNNHNESVNDPIESVVLLSRESITSLLSWYRSNLDLRVYSEFTVPIGTDLKCNGKEPITEKFFVFTNAKLREFCWNRDYLKGKILILKPANEVYRSHGYKSTIEFQQIAT